MSDSKWIEWYYWSNELRAKFLAYLGGIPKDDMGECVASQTRCPMHYEEQVGIALDLIDECISLEPVSIGGNESVLQLRAKCLASLGRATEAIEVYRQASTVEPTCDTAWGSDCGRRWMDAHAYSLAIDRQMTELYSESVAFAQWLLMMIDVGNRPYIASQVFDGHSIIALAGHVCGMDTEHHARIALRIAKTLATDGRVRHGWDKLPSYERLDRLRAIL